MFFPSSSSRVDFIHNHNILMLQISECIISWKLCHNHIFEINNGSNIFLRHRPPQTFPAILNSPFFSPKKCFFFQLSIVLDSITNTKDRNINRTIQQIKIFHAELQMLKIIAVYWGKNKIRTQNGNQLQPIFTTMCFNDSSILNEKIHFQCFGW